MTKLNRSNKRVFIGVAWPYVNGDLHIGHLAGYLLPADICARYNRLEGRDVLMVSGSDCFGTPITVEADKRGVSPREIADEYHEKDVDLFLNKLNLTYDEYTRTDHPNHVKITQDFFVKMLEEGAIFIDTTEQYYSPKEERFLPDRYVVGECPFCGFKDARSDQCDNCGKLITHGELINPRSNLNGEKVELKQSEHYFVDWPSLQPRLERYVSKVSGNWKEWVRNETLGWMTEGLKPRAISRDISWGVSIPADRISEEKLIKDHEHKRLYVWFDAVVGYYSGSVLWEKDTGVSIAKFWENVGTENNPQKHYYFMGKDNLVFHTLFWPGQLMVYDEALHLPDTVSINMFLNFEGRQFSKSRGVSIGIDEIIEQYGNDPVRFYLTQIMPELRDSSFSWEDFKEKVNGVLVANLGNFIHRSLSLGYGLDIGDLEEHEVEPKVKEAVDKAFSSARDNLENCRFRFYLDDILALSGFGNSLVDAEMVWELKKINEDSFKHVMKQLYFIVISLGLLMNPLLPHASQRLFKMLGVETPELWPEKRSNGELFDIFRAMKPHNKPEPLFNKLE